MGRATQGEKAASNQELHKKGALTDISAESAEWHGLHTIGERLARWIRLRSVVRN